MNNRNRKVSGVHRRWLILFLIPVVILAAVSVYYFRDTSQDRELALSQEAARNEEIDPLDVQVIEDEGLSFSFHIDEFVDRYNAYYRRDNGEACLPDTGDTVHYYYTEDESIITLPTLNINASDSGRNVQEIILSFDWHSYSEALMEVFESMCFYTVKTLFPEMPDEDITALYSGVIDSAYDHPGEEWFGADALPYALFYKGGAGIYSYYASGDRQYLCVIPVTEDSLNGFRDRGVKVYSTVER